MKNRKIEIKWALIFVATTLLWLLLERLFGFHSSRIQYHMIATNFFLIPAIAIYVFALMDKRNSHYSGAMSYKQALISGVIISLIITLFIPITQSLISFVISPIYFPNMIEYSVSNGLYSQQEAEAYFNLTNYIIQGLIATPILGIVTTLIVGIFVKKSPSTNE